MNGVIDEICRRGGRIVRIVGRRIRIEEGLYVFQVDEDSTSGLVSGDDDDASAWDAFAVNVINRLL